MDETTPDGRIGEASADLPASGVPAAERLRALIRDVPDFPRKGVLFRDITTLLRDPAALRTALDLFSERYEGRSIDLVLGIESRGFLFGTPLALRLGAGFVPVRKRGKLPWRTYSETYALEYGDDVVEMHEDAVDSGQRVLIVDDLIATGGTARAAANLVRRAGGEVAGLGFLIELGFLQGRDQLRDYDVFSLLRY